MSLSVSLQAEGFSADEIKTIAVPKIPDRMALLASGELKAGVMPDPLASLVVGQGGVIVADDFEPSRIWFQRHLLPQGKSSTRTPKLLKVSSPLLKKLPRCSMHDPAKYKNVLSEQKSCPRAIAGCLSSLQSFLPRACPPKRNGWML